MTAQKVHKARIEEHFQVLREAVAIGIEQRVATLGLHTSACAIDLLETYLHKIGKIPIGMQVKHDWFKRPHPGQKIVPLAERKLPMDFPQKEAILELFYTLEENRNILVYGHATKDQLLSSFNAFRRLKELLLKMLAEQGEEIEDPN